MGSYRSATVYHFYIRLNFIEPPIWRRITVPGQISLFKFHQLLQVSMGWENYHLHQFILGKKRYGEPDPEDDQMKRDKNALLSATVREEGMHLLYEYDFGDGWQHDITVEKIEHFDVPDWVVPHCVDGARACPPEDCGGIGGYSNLLEALQNPQHPEHQSMRRWVGPHFEAELFSVPQVNSALAVLE